MKQNIKKGQKNHTGALGEEVTACFMKNQGFVLLEQNYTRKCGEIDLIMQKDAIVHFVEVKTVSYETKDQLEQAKVKGYRPEEQFTAQKYQKLLRTLKVWLMAEHYQGDYQLDLVTVRLVPTEKYAWVEYFPNPNAL